MAEGTAGPGAYRVGMIVPSSNVTIEAEVGDLLRLRSQESGERFSVHSSRARMLSVNAGELAAMVAESDRCVVELADAEVDVIAYGCLVAIMAQGFPAHEEIERRLRDVAAEAGCPVPLVTSAGALVRVLHARDIKKVCLIVPYVRSLTDLVIAYVEASGIEVVDHVCLEIERNSDVARHDPENLLTVAKSLDTRRADAVVLSTCVQMPSLPVLARAEEMLQIPVLSAATATYQEVVEGLGLEPALVTSEA